MRRLVAILASGMAAFSPIANAAPPVVDEAEALSYFPQTYDQSRARFRQACRQALASPDDFCRSSPVASQVDQDLTIDHGFFSRGGDRLVVLQSGIHGPETPAGAAVQAMVFQRYLARLLDRGIDVYFIHALNPYGFKYNRRTDEFNVNLNRNFSADGSAFRLKNPDYTRFRNLFEPKGPVGALSVDSLAIGAQFIGYDAGDGFDARPITNGLDTGQYEYPQGMNYGGAAPAEQSAFLRQELTPILSRPYRKILFLDFHTGLGDAGVLAVIKGIKPSAALMREFQTMLGDEEKDGIVIRSGENKGFFPTTGDVIDFVPGLAPQPDAVLALTMEYGTMGTDIVSELRSAARMILENQAHFNGCRDQERCEAVRRNFRELFDPPDMVWRLKVISEADRVFSLLTANY